MWGKKLSDPYNVKLRVWDWLSKFFGPLVKRASSFTLTDFVTEEREREREREKERKKERGGPAMACARDSSRGGGWRCTRKCATNARGVGVHRKNKGSTAGFDPQSLKIFQTIPCF